MKGFKPIFRREMYSFFASPTFYVVSFIFVVVAGYFFYSAVAFYSLLSFQGARNPIWMQQLNPAEMVLRPFFMDVSVVLLLICPLLTMRLFAEEKKTGTGELLFTYPLSDTGIILGKFSATIAIITLIMLGTLPSMIFLDTITHIRWQVVATGYLGLFLLASAFISLGMLASSVTKNQIIAAVIALGTLLLFWVIGWSKAFVGPQFGNIIEYASIINHFENFAKGILDLRDIIYYFVFTTLFLFLTFWVIESQKWRG